MMRPDGGSVVGYAGPSEGSVVVYKQLMVGGMREKEQRESQSCGESWLFLDDVKERAAVVFKRTG